MQSWFARRPKIAVLAVGVLLLAAIFSVLLSREREGLRVTFLDVGQGDAVLIESPSGTALLYDGGPGAQVLAPLASALPLFDRTIDMVIASHPDRDHIGGLLDVFDRYQVRALLEPGVRSENGTDAALLAAAEAEGVSPGLARAGDILDLGGEAYAEVLFPDRDVVGMETNSASIVLRVRYGETSLLLTGDLPASIETYLVASSPESFRTDILKLGHHGSRTSSADAFLTAVAPSIAIVSAGCGNSYGHPHTEVLERLAAHRIAVRSTCDSGSVAFESDGRTWSQLR
ncbi:MAG TPA: ComEC/Rec2 family competence protein [Candidatus Paceibacterota bacterium]|nr:ComEC/Rec2 family competence protein [Candidatus Paceibacterota bacterium]